MKAQIGYRTGTPSVHEECLYHWATQAQEGPSTPTISVIVMSSSRFQASPSIQDPIVSSNHVPIAQILM